MPVDANPRSDTILSRLLELHPRRIDLTLDRVWALLEKLDNPQQNLPPVVHIAGTNGKGSTLAYLQAIAETAGLRVHRYSSPHLVRFHERITLNGQYISEVNLAALLAEVEEIQGDQPITFFEITTAAAFLAFQRNPADLLLLETGLGGRLDATNVVPQPALTILSPISLDHTEFLGETIGAIASEKVAIARRHVPMISAAQQPEAREVIVGYAHDNDVSLLLDERDWSFQTSARGFDWSDPHQSISLPTPTLIGAHQISNAALATTAAIQLEKQGFDLSPVHIATGIRQAKWPGRMQLLTQGRLLKNIPADVQLWLDGGHNPDAAQSLAVILRELSDVRLIIGMLGNKDCCQFLGFLAPFLMGGQALRITDTEASHTAESLAALAEGLLEPAMNIEQAIDRAVKDGSKNIVICGSLYLVGEALRLNEDIRLDT